MVKSIMVMQIENKNIYRKSNTIVYSMLHLTISSDKMVS